MPVFLNGTYPGARQCGRDNTLSPVLSDNKCSSFLLVKRMPTSNCDCQFHYVCPIIREKLFQALAITCLSVISFSFDLVIFFLVLFPVFKGIIGKWASGKQEVLPSISLNLKF